MSINDKLVTVSASNFTKEYTMNFIDALNWRYAVSQFSNKKVSKQQINGLIESVRLSASAYGLQPYKLLVVNNDAIKRDLFTFGYGQTQISDNSHLFIFAYETRITQQRITSFIAELANSQDESPLALKDYEQIISNDLLTKTHEEQQHWSAQQCYIALGKLLSYSAMNKIDACPMTGFDNKGVNQVLGLNKLGLSAEILCPVGFRSVNDKRALRVKYRKPLSDIVTTL